MNTKGKIDFTKTDNIQFIEEVAREISKEDKDWQWEVRKIKQHSLLLWWELLEGSGQEGFRIEYDEANEVFSVWLHGSCETHARHMHRLSILAD